MPKGHKNPPKPSDEFLAHGDFVYRHKPVLNFVKASGPFLEDDQGRRYFDAEAANGTASLGFDNSIVEQALSKIKDIPTVPSFCESEIRLKAAARIAKKINSSIGHKGRVAFELGGAQGIELALKIAKLNNNKTYFAVFEGGYHGRSIYTSHLSASHRYRSLMGDWSIPVIRLPYPDFKQYKSSFNYKSLKSQAIESVKRKTREEFGGVAIHNRNPDISALIIEPILNAGGIVMPDPEYLETVVKIFRRLGAIIIIDEIFCGFHRTGPMFGFQHFNIQPDIIVMSKAITNGVTPLSCVWARNPYLGPKKFPPGTHSATFINNPLALAVADVVLDRYENWTSLSQDIKKLETFLSATIKDIVKSSKLATSGYAIGGVGRILLKKNLAGKLLDIASTVAWRNPVDDVHGLILASTGMVPNVVALNPPLNLSTRQLITLRKLLVRVFNKANSKLE